MRRSSAGAHAIRDAWSGLRTSSSNSSSSSSDSSSNAAHSSAHASALSSAWMRSTMAVG
jgi:hypothetical protein